MKKIKYWFRSLKRIKTVKNAQDMNLEWQFNVYGDVVNMWNCRSIWCDEFGFLYKCKELFKTEE